MVLSFVLAGLISAPAALEWSAPEECPGVEEARSLVEAELQSVDPQRRENLRAQGTVRAEPPGYVVDVVIDGPDGHIERSVSIEDCSAAAEAFALVVAIAVDPTHEEEPEEEDDTADVPPPPPEAVEPEAQPQAQVIEPPPPEVRVVEPRPPPAPKRNFVPRGAIAVGGGVGVGLLPAVGGRVGGEAALVWTRARLGLGVEHWIRRQTDLATPAGSSVRLSIISVRLRGGPILRVRKVEFPLLAAAGVGAVVGSGVGVPSGQTRAVLWADVGASAGVQWFFRPWVGVGAQADLVVALVRHEFVFGDSLVVARNDLVGGVFRAGFEFRFP